MPVENGARAVELGMIGPGRVGAGLVRRPRRDGHRCVVYGLNDAAVLAAVDDGIPSDKALQQ